MVKELSALAKHETCMLAQTYCTCILYLLAFFFFFFFQTTRGNLLKPRTFDDDGGVVNGEKANGHFVSLASGKVLLMSGKVREKNLYKQL